MMIPEAIPQEYSTIILVLLLITTFVIAFKVMELVFETLMVSALSAAFYVGYTVLLGGGLPQVVINDILLFAVLGAAFYMSYSFLSSAYGIARKVIHVPYVVLTSIYSMSKKSYGFVSNKLKEAGKGKETPSDVKEDNGDGNDGGSNNTVKEVVLSQDQEEEKED